MSAASTPALLAGLGALDGTAADIQGLGSASAGANGLGADAAHAHPRPSSLWLPSDVGLAAANGDPRSAGAILTMIAGTIYLVRVNIWQAVTFSKVFVVVNTGSAGASGGNFIGIYSSAGTQLNVSSDFGTALGTPGPQPVTVGSTSVAAGSFFDVAMVVNAGSSQPHLYGYGMPAADINFGQALASLQFAVNGTGQTVLPSSLTLGSSTNAGALPFWVGLAA